MFIVPWSARFSKAPESFRALKLLLDHLYLKYFHLLRSSPQITEIFPAKSVFPAYRRTKNLKEVLAPSKFRPSSAANQTVIEGGCFKCDKNRCDMGKNFLLQASKFQSSDTGRHYPIRQKLSCSSKNVIYLATCCKCNLQYVGSTSTEFKLDSETINRTCSTIEELVNWRCIIIVPNTTFLKSVSLLLSKLYPLKSIRFRPVTAYQRGVLDDAIIHT